MGEDTFLFFRALGINLSSFMARPKPRAHRGAADGEVRCTASAAPLPGVEIRINDSGEILVRVRLGVRWLFRRCRGDRRALVDGWLHTGDAGYLEPNGQLVVLGRVSEVVRTAAGERFIPNYIENRIKFSPYVKQRRRPRRRPR